MHSELLLTIIREAGEIALTTLNDSHPRLKPDKSVITDADKLISRLAHERLGHLLATGAHILVDEEDPRRGEFQNEDALSRAEYVWAIDPIDATRVYANRMPFYGISLGVVRNRRPWMGAVYFPSLRELFLSDGTGSFFITDPFTSLEKRVPIVPQQQEISDVSLFIPTDSVIDRIRWDSKDCRAIVLSAAVCEFCWPVIGRGCGSLARVHFWDMAGAWPMFEAAGLKLFNVRTGEPFVQLDLDAFRADPPWKFNDFYLLSSPENFETLRSRIRMSEV